MTFLGMDPPQVSRPPEAEKEKHTTGMADIPADQPAEKDLAAAIPHIGE